MPAMPMVLLRLSDAAFTPIKRPQRCPNCGSQILQRWGKSSRVVQDIDPHIIEVSRFRCEECCSTFRWYPPGVSRSTWSRQIRNVAAILFAMGLSSREIMNILSKAGIRISHSMVWREGRELLERMNGGAEIRNSIHFAINRDYIPPFSKHLGVVLAVEFKPGKVVTLGTLDEFDPRRVKNWLDSLSDEVNISIVETSLLPKYSNQEVEEPARH